MIAPSTLTSIFLAKTVLLFIVIAIGLPMYIRIIYILCRKSYRSKECYQIMIHIAIVQCFYAPATLSDLVSIVLGYDPGNLAYILIKLCSCVVRMEAVLSLALALNRLRVMCALKYPSCIHTAIIIFAWILGVLNYAFLFSPWYDYFVAEGDILAHYEKSLSGILKTASITLISSCSMLTFASYGVVVFHLVKAQKGLIMDLGSRTERKILMYAFVKFLFDALLTIGMYFPLPRAKVVEVVVVTGFVMNNLLIPPLLYLLFNRDVRQDFFPQRPTIVASSS
uniref:G_PROTEIN_RECEP_F1_2 domain-containing protein n=1 Tax=Steinernema glaseri TaxID=37863 RepID=A0A1I7ZBV5_9BILA